MNVNHEISLLEKLRQEIVSELDWGDPLDWTHSKYESLTETIYEKTRVQLGSNTLKRFFGKIESKSLPGKTTKDVLAQFAGYISYMDFCSRQTETVVKPGKINWKAILSGIIVLFILGILVWVIPSIKHKMKLSHVSGLILVKDTIGTVPFTQTFYYYTQGVSADSLQIRQRGKDPIIIATTDSVKNSIHFVPGRRQVDLLYDGKILSTVSYNVITPGWLFIYPYDENSPRHYIPIDTVNYGFLQITKQTLETARINITDKEPMLSYFNFKDFGLDGNDFTFSTRIKNPKSIDEKMCQDAVIMIHTDTLGYYLNLTQKGCEIYNKFYFGEKKLDGTTTELGQLSLNLDQWQDIKIVAKPGGCKLFINNEEVISEPFFLPLGTVNGIVFQFRGSGMVDFVNLLDAEGAVVYRNDF